MEMTGARSLRGWIRGVVDAVPPLGRALRDLRDWRTMATLQRVDSEFGFVFWGGNYLVSGVQEPDELRLVSRQLATADVLIDCGANAGLFTCLAAARGVPAIAIEPYPPNLAILYRNIEENRFAVPVEVFPVALGERPGIASLFGRGQGASLVKGWGGLPSYDSNKVSVLPLDAIVGRRFDGARILLKIDVEGGEWSLLRGAAHLLDQRPRVLMELSFSRNHPDGHHPAFHQVLDLFWKRGYRVADALAPDDPASIVTPKRVAAWFDARRSDLGGENLWLTPP